MYRPRYRNLMVVLAVSGVVQRLGEEGVNTFAGDEASR